MPVARDEGLIGWIEVVGSADAGDAGIVTERLKRALHLRLERGIGGSEGGVAEDQIEGKRPIRKLPGHERGRAPRLGGGKAGGGGGPGAVRDYDEGGGE